MFYAGVLRQRAAIFQKPHRPSASEPVHDATGKVATAAKIGISMLFF